LPFALEGDPVLFRGHASNISVASVKLKRWLVIITGTLAMGVGAVGVFVPMLHVVFGIGFWWVWEIV